MKHTGKYCHVESEYDIDHIINIAVEKTKLFVEDMKDEAENDEDAKNILKAIASTIVESI